MYIEESGLSQGGIYRFYNDLDEIWKNTSLWKEIIQINLTEQLRNVKVPYIVLQGDESLLDNRLSSFTNSLLSENLSGIIGHALALGSTDTHGVFHAAADVQLRIAQEQAGAEGEVFGHDEVGSAARRSL